MTTRVIPSPFTAIFGRTSQVFIPIFFTFMLTACGWNMNGVSGKERTEYLASIKPYGAHWIKEGMTREMLQYDFKECGGDSVSLKAGYVRQPGQTTANYFEGLNQHTLIVHACMKNKGYMYREKCDSLCVTPL